MYQSPLADRIAKFKKEWEQASGQKAKNDSDSELRRYIIIGEIVMEAFPKFSKFEPKETEIENDIEFAPIKELMSILSDCGVIVDGL